MELRIKPFPKNNYPKKGLLIKGSSPLIWLHEVEILGIDLEQVKSFAIPSDELNVLYGCLLVFNNIPQEIGKNAYFQCVDDKLFIPENTTFYPKINPEDWQNIDSEFLIMHPEFGLVKLSEQIDWISLIQEPEQAEVKIRKPLNGVKIPQKIESYTVEMDDQKVLEALQKPQTEEEWMKNLPFDMKKVMAGNKKEIEKYLKYIEKHPDRAVDLGVPLDIMGTSRGDGFGKFKFDTSWFGKLFGGSSSGGSSSRSRDYRWVFWVFLILISLGRLSSVFKDSSKSETFNEIPASGNVVKNLPENTLVYRSGVTDIDMKIDSMYGDKRYKLRDERMKATLNLYDYNNKNSYKEYLEKGGRPIEAISNDIESLENKIKTSKDSLKKVYRKKIVTYIEKNTEKIKKSISDSIKKINPGKSADKEIVKSVWNKKRIVIEDSLGRYYGTTDIPEPVLNQKIETIPPAKVNEDYPKNNVSFAEIIWLIIFMTGAVGLYSFIIKRKPINIGGENVPAGIKIFLMVILLAMLIYLFYPLIAMFGYNWFVWLLIIGVVFLLYRLFSEDKTILKSGKDE